MFYMYIYAHVYTYIIYICIYEYICIYIYIDMTCIYIYVLLCCIIPDDYGSQCIITYYQVSIGLSSV